MKNKVQGLHELLNKNPKKIIAWARKEIREYERLIKTVEEQRAKNKK